MNPLPRPLPFSRNPKPIRSFKPVSSALLAFAAAAALLANPAPAANLLVNPGFDQNSQHAIPIGWTRFAPPTAQLPGNYYIEAQIPPHSLPYYYKEWGACYDNTNNVAGIYQDLSCAPGSVFQATNWFY